MSIFSYLNNDTYGSSSSVSSQAALALQQAQAKASAKTSDTGTTTTGTGQSNVLITVAAKRAAATEADAAKDAGTLAKDLRASLDAQYKAAGKKNSADLTTLSGRALSVMALNDSGLFSKSEMAAAKLELRARDRQSAIAQISSGGLTSASLAAYSKNLLASRTTMSAEERQLRDGNPNLR